MKLISTYIIGAWYIGAWYIGTGISRLAKINMNFTKMEKKINRVQDQIEFGL